jgi:DNA-binding transcriptional ArsR family regulator
LNERNGDTGTATRSVGRPGFTVPSSFIDTDLMKMLSDELRVRIFAYLCDHTATADEVAKALSEHPSKVRYHLKELRQGGWIADDPSIPGRGGHFFATRPSILSPSTWERLPEAARHRIAVKLMRLLFEDAAASMEAGYFLRPGAQVSLTPMVLDVQGKEDARRVVERALEELLVVQTQSDLRLEEGDRGDAAAGSFTVSCCAFESLRDPSLGARAPATMRL